MGINLIWIGLGLAAAGYFIGEGLKNFKNPNAHGLSEIFAEDDEHELIKLEDVHYFMGVAKEDAEHLIKDHPDIPHILIKDEVYFPKAKLRQWLKNLGS